jgi:hypothetical protein
MSSSLGKQDRSELGASAQLRRLPSVLVRIYPRPRSGVENMGRFYRSPYLRVRYSAYARMSTFGFPKVFFCDI